MTHEQDCRGLERLLLSHMSQCLRLTLRDSGYGRWLRSGGQQPRELADLVLRHAVRHALDPCQHVLHVATQMQVQGRAPRSRDFLSAQWTESPLPAGQQIEQLNSDLRTYVQSHAAFSVMARRLPAATRDIYIIECPGAASSPLFRYCRLAASGAAARKAAAEYRLPAILQLFPRLNLYLASQWRPFIPPKFTELCHAIRRQYSA